MVVGKLFYSVLNMGLGHAARSLPLIMEFHRKGWDVWVGSSGRTLSFLKAELPDLRFVETPDYHIEYASNGWLIPRLIPQIPRVLRQIRRETVLCAKIVRQFAPDLIISDHCYGMYHPRVPSYFLTHQIYFAMPGGCEFVSPWISQFNFSFHRKYQKVVIPDHQDIDGGLLSGFLSRKPNGEPRYLYGGILSSVQKCTIEKDLDLLVSISGPEPQRTIFQEKILAQVDSIPGQKVVVLGKSEVIGVLKETRDLKVYSHVTRREMQNLMNRARMIISRPGYTTLMELAELGKKALLVPTPGQTEQLYLAQRAMEKGWFYSVEQEALNLSRDMEIAMKFPGLSLSGSTRRNVSYILEKLVGGGSENPRPVTS